MTAAIAYNDQVSGTQQRERLILEHLPQVRWIAMRIHEKLPATFSLEDLISTGIIGLINAIDGFDPTHNAQLKTYAEYKIRGAILDSIRGLDGIPCNRRKQVKQVENTILTLEQRLRRSPSEEEIAAELKIPLAEYHELLIDLRGVTLGSLDSPAPGTEGPSLMSFIASDVDGLPLHQLERSELERLLAEGLTYLPRPEQLVLTLYYKEEQNMREIAPILGLSLTRVSQLKSQGIMRLRSFLKKKWPTERGLI